jgi:hypothetical protein
LSRGLEKGCRRGQSAYVLSLGDTSRGAQIESFYAGYRYREVNMP